MNDKREVINPLISDFLLKKDADFTRFTDIPPNLSEKAAGFPRAVFFGCGLPKDFLRAIRFGIKTDDAFLEYEKKTDAMADALALYIENLGFRALSLSESENCKNGFYDASALSSALPHKTVGILAGFGRIGKNNLLINDKYGCAFSMCTVLTDAPLNTYNPPPSVSDCKSCSKCVKACPRGALYGNVWTEGGGRERLFNAFICDTDCISVCIAVCPYSVRYANSVE
jgi:epoxyqueuosine reductase QueG